MTVDVSVVDDDGGPVATVTRPQLHAGRRRRPPRPRPRQARPTGCTSSPGGRADDPRRTAVPRRPCPGGRGPDRAVARARGRARPRPLPAPARRRSTGSSADYVVAALSAARRAASRPASRIAAADLDVADRAPPAGGTAPGRPGRRRPAASATATPGGARPTAPADMTARWQELVQRYPEGTASSGSLAAAASRWPPPCAATPTRCSCCSPAARPAAPSRCTATRPRPGTTTPSSATRWRRWRPARRRRRDAGRAAARPRDRRRHRGHDQRTCCPACPPAASSTPSPTSRRCSWPGPGRRSARTPASSFATLDIEADPEVQGFAAHGYDVVIAANVLHATADLRTTFAHVARLLAPGGLLLLLEMTKPQRFIDISFGLTPGWWKFTDTDLRPDSLLLDRDGWMPFLADAGFGAARGVPALDSRRPASICRCRRCSSPGPPRPPASPSAARPAVVADPRRRGRRRRGAGRARRLAGGGHGDRGHRRRRVRRPYGPGSRTSSIRPIPSSWPAWSPRPRPAVGTASSTSGASTRPATLTASARRPAHRQRAVAGAGARSAAARRRSCGSSPAAPRGCPAPTPDPDTGPAVGLRPCRRPRASRAALHPRRSRPAPDGRRRRSPCSRSCTRRRRGPGPPPRVGRAAVARLVPCPEAASPGGDRAAPFGWPCRATACSTTSRCSRRPDRPRTRRGGDPRPRRRAQLPGRHERPGHAGRPGARGQRVRRRRRRRRRRCDGTCAVGDAVVAVAAGSFGTYATAIGRARGAQAGAGSASPRRPPSRSPSSRRTTRCTTRPRLAAGETVLVHAAAGGVGLAAVQLARRAGARRARARRAAPHKRAYLGAARRRAGDGLPIGRLRRRGRTATRADAASTSCSTRSPASSSAAASTCSHPAAASWSSASGRSGRAAEVAARCARASRYHTVPLADDIAQRPAAVGRLLRELRRRGRRRRARPASRPDLRSGRRTSRVPLHGPGPPHRQDRARRPRRPSPTPARTVELVRADGDATSSPAAWPVSACSWPSG